MKTAIDWLMEQYKKDDGKFMPGVYEQAKEIERKQHETTFYRGINIGALNPELDIEGRNESSKHYYESTFGQLDNQKKGRIQDISIG
jgi:hypothetical protein